MPIVSLIILSSCFCIDSFLICLSTSPKKRSFYLIIPLTICLFHLSFITLGYFLGNFMKIYFEQSIQHIIFLIFSLSGVKVIINSLLHKNNPNDKISTISHFIILTLSCSFDSLFLGTFLNLSAHILSSLLIIGTAIYVSCLSGLLIKKRAYDNLDDTLSIIGSAILFFYAFKSLL